jgi:hypothetical protein
MKIQSIQALDGYKLDLTFPDGVKGVVDLSDLVGQGVFAAWLDKTRFYEVFIGSGGEATWKCGVDLCADSLYLRITGKSAEDLFPALSRESICA